MKKQAYIFLVGVYFIVEKNKKREKNVTRKTEI